MFIIESQSIAHFYKKIDTSHFIHSSFILLLFLLFVER